MSSKSTVVATNLSLGYSRQVALTDINFKLSKGESLALLGPNGGGKTTLILGLLGLAEKLGGSYHLAGQASYVPQGQTVNQDYPATALDVVLMGSYQRLSWYQSTRKFQQEGIDLLRQVDMADSHYEDFHSLSGGQKQRVLIARALMEKTETLLLDEPFSGVDRKSTESLLDLLEKLRNAGHTILISTHDIMQAKRSSKVLCLNHRQIAFGEPEETLTSEVVQSTYGSEIVTLSDGTAAVATGHHSH